MILLAKVVYFTIFIRMGIMTVLAADKLVVDDYCVTTIDIDNQDMALRVYAWGF